MASRKFECYERNLRVLVDMDMVLCDFESKLLENFREKYPNDPYIPLEKRDGFYARDQYEKLRSDLPDKIREIYNSENFFKDLPEIDGAIEAVKEMDEMDGVDVYICTSPLVCYDFCVKEKFEWIDNHFGKEWLDKLIVTKDKTLVYGHVLIDDRPKIKGGVKKPSWEHVVFTACHNVRSKLAVDKKRLDSWTDGRWRDVIKDFQKRI